MMIETNKEDKEDLDGVRLAIIPSCDHSDISINVLCMICIYFSNRNF